MKFLYKEENLNKKTTKTAYSPMFFRFSVVFVFKRGFQKNHLAF